MDKTYFIGIDGGGTNTKVLIVDESGKKLSELTAPGSNYGQIGNMESAAEIIRRAVTEALAGISPDAINHVGGCVAGLAGMDSTEEKSAMAKLLRFDQFRPLVLNDAEPLLCDGAEVALICGTGSICLGRKGGVEVAVGGHGPLFDEAGGRWLGREALETLSKLEDGRLDANQDDGAEFKSSLFRTLGVSDFADLYPDLYHNGDDARYDLYNKLPEPLMSLASGGNRTALGLVNDAATELALHIKAVINKLGLHEPKLNYTGSVLVKNRIFQDLLWQETARLGVVLGQTTAIDNPVEAAASLARL